MSRLRELPIEQLLQLFSDLCVQQGEIMRKFYFDPNEQIRDVVPVSKRIWNIHHELAARGSEAERQLLPFLDHPNPWVRTPAARQLLPYEEEKALAVLTQIEATSYPRSDIWVEVRLLLGSWRDGTYKGVKPVRDEE